MTMSKWMVSAGLVLLLNPVMGFAIAPVVDYSESANDTQETGVALAKPVTQSSQLSVSDRVQRLETKVDNLSQANLSSRVEELQQTIQELRGQLEKQAHELELLSTNQKTFYQDLNSRITQAATVSHAPAAAPAPAPVAAAPAAGVDEDPVPAPKVSAAKPKGNAAQANSAVAKDNAAVAKPSLATAANAPKPKPIAAEIPAAVSASPEQTIYQQGFALLKSKQYDRALTQFKDYVSKYPQGHYAVNAHFWMGEINYLQGKHAAAKKSFEIVVKNYPKDQKIPDALLKLAIIATDNGQKQKAEEMLVQIQKQYPGTTAARLAMIRAQELRLSMH
jgi:tol-pal system protein YbgF